MLIVFVRVISDVLCYIKIFSDYRVTWIFIKGKRDLFIQYAAQALLKSSSHPVTALFEQARAAAAIVALFP